MRNRIRANGLRRPRRQTPKADFGVNRGPTVQRMTLTILNRRASARPFGSSALGRDAPLRWDPLNWRPQSPFINLPIFFRVFGMPAAAEYAADIALTCIAFPSITTGIAVAMVSASTRL